MVTMARDSTQWRALEYERDWSMGIRLVCLGPRVSEVLLSSCGDNSENDQDMYAVL